MKMLRRALEDSTNGQTGDELSVVMSGPLAENYTKALDLALAKTDPETGQPIGQTNALESAQQESVLMQKLISQIVPEKEANVDDYMTVYGVNKDSVSETEIVQVAQLLENQEKSPSQVVVVMDATMAGPNGPQSSPPTERYINLAAAMESLCAANNVPVYSSLREFVLSRKR